MTDRLNQFHSAVCMSICPRVARTVLWQALFLWPTKLYPLLRPCEKLLSRALFPCRCSEGYYRPDYSFPTC